MKTALALLLCLVCAQSFAVDLPKVDLIKEPKDDNTYAIQNGKVVIEGTLIKEIEIRDAELVVTYLNKGANSRRPQYEVMLINAYGAEVSRCQIVWSFESVSSGAIRIEHERRFPRPAKEILERTAIKFPEDWLTPVYIVIEGATP